MAYCRNCGHRLIDGSKFCNNCGTPKSEQSKSTYSERKQEYAGKIIKCPSCGAELQSFTAVCPDCGHEINSQNVSSSLKEFINSINEYDKAIANDSEPPKTGWKTWSKGKKFLWVILNIVTSFIPLVVYLVFPLIKPFLLPKSVPVLSANEKKKATLIENYTFPNEREATIEAMMFTKSKIAFLASEKFNKKTLYWTNLWNTKAEQLNQRARIILKDDKIIETTYAEITASKSKVDKSVKVRAIIGSVIIVVFLAFLLINGSIFNCVTNILSSIGVTSQTANNENFEWLETGLSTKVPKLDSYKGQIETNTDTELWIRLEGVTYNEFEKYVSACKEMGYTVDIKKDTTGYEAYNTEGYYIDIYLWSSTKGTFDIQLKAPLKFSKISWPSSGPATLIPKPSSDMGNISTDSDRTFTVYISGMTIDDFNDYVDECIAKGFEKDSRHDTSFFASKGDDIDLSIEYEGFNTVYISITN